MSLSSSCRNTCYCDDLTTEQVINIVANDHCLLVGDYGIRLRFFDMEAYVCGRTQGYRLYAISDCPVNIDHNIFVYQRIPNIYNDPPYQDRFTNIASPGDIAEYPVATPGPASSFFRLDTLDLVFRNVCLLESALKAILWDVRELLNTYNLMRRLKLRSSVVLGQEGCLTSSESSSIQSSSSVIPDP